MAHLMPTNKAVTAQQTAQYYVNNVARYQDISILTEVHNLPPIWERDMEDIWDMTYI